MAASADLSLREVTEFLDDRVASFKLPKDLVVVPRPPRNAGGKVIKGMLRGEDEKIVAGRPRPPGR